MAGWQWFWTLVGFVVFIVVLVFLYYYQPFEDLFVLVLNGIGYDNAIFWVALITGIVGFCTYHWHAYRVHIVQQHSVESMVLSSLKGSTFTAIFESLVLGANRADHDVCAVLQGPLAHMLVWVRTDGKLR